MRISTQVFATAALLVVTVVSANGFERGEAKITFRVVDDAGAPVTNAEVRCAAWWPDTAHLPGKEYDAFSGPTDSNGLACVRVVAYHDMRCTFTKPGYYDTHLPYVFSGRAKPEIVEGRWQPWGITNTVLLKLIRQPVPMYARRVQSPTPVLDAPAGYDLEKGDWVDPHGKGIVSDLVFVVGGKYQDGSHSDLDMSVLFNGPGSGIITGTVPISRNSPIGSKLVSAHEAPVDGYTPKYDYSRRVRPRMADRVHVRTRFDQIAYFRVRTEVDEKGQVKKAWYGKMYGDLYCAFDSDKRICVNFTYYLNPDGTRNVEFDPTRNLLTGLKSLEQVDRP